jgi:hypothetical protein
MRNFGNSGSYMHACAEIRWPAHYMTKNDVRKGLSPVLIMAFFVIVIVGRYKVQSNVPMLPEPLLGFRMRGNGHLHSLPEVICIADGVARH